MQKSNGSQEITENNVERDKHTPKSPFSKVGTESESVFIDVVYT